MTDEKKESSAEMQSVRQEWYQMSQRYGELVFRKIAIEDELEVLKSRLKTIDLAFPAMQKLETELTAKYDKPKLEAVPSSN